MTDIELFKQALDSLDNVVRGNCDGNESEVCEALRARLAQPEPEPIGWLLNGEIYEVKQNIHGGVENPDQIPLYTAPQRREWVGLTLEEIFDSTHGFTRIQKDDWVATDTDIAEFAHIIEAKLKEKNT